MIAGLEEPSAGSDRDRRRAAVATLRRAGLSVAFQDPSLLPWRSVRGNIELALNLARRRRVEASEIDQLITLVGLDGFAETRRRNFRAACASARPLRGRLPPSRAFCCSMSRSARWMN
jgi:ABC-type nitrate/sulfonate/bicarbonate transport system ATPase subunit